MRTSRLIYLLSDRMSKRVLSIARSDAGTEGICRLQQGFTESLELESEKRMNSYCVAGFEQKTHPTAWEALCLQTLSDCEGSALGADGGREHCYKLSQQQYLELQSRRGENLIAAALGVRHGEAHPEETREQPEQSPPSKLEKSKISMA